jgi:K+-transporting ATPase KdpF subunit
VSALDVIGGIVTVLLVLYLLASLLFPERF